MAGAKPLPYLTESGHHGRQVVVALELCLRAFVDHLTLVAVTSSSKRRLEVASSMEVTRVGWPGSTAV
jgi:hypothetical protein